MGFRAFFIKEWYGSRRNIAVLLVLLVVLPGAAAAGTSVFQQTIPEDIPIGVAPGGDDVHDDELDVIRGGTAMHASPQQYETSEEARDALVREEVYLVLEPDPGLFEEGEDVNVTLVSDQRLAPFQEPANYTESIVEFELDRQLPANVNVDHERIGEQYTLSEYLVPTALIAMVMLFAFLYLPLELYRERDVFERVELTSRIEAALAAKLVFYALLLVIPILVFQLVSAWLGYRIDHFNLHTFAVIGLTFLYVSAVSAGVMFATRLRRVGLFINLGIMTAVFTLSSFIYPVGFFSTIRKEIALSMPTYYSMVITRSTMMKETPLTMFNDEITRLLITTLVALAFLQITLMYYRRRT